MESPAFRRGEEVKESPDGESRASIVRLGDAFPLDPTPGIYEAGTESPSTVRPWGLRFAVTPKVRAEIVGAADRHIYDPVTQQGVDRVTGAPSLGKRSSGTKETTGDPDGKGPTPEETTND